jgi:predicted nucleic acid-binding protein
VEGYFLYLDTSALVKLYVEEEHSDLVERAAGCAAAVFVSDLADLEARVAFARLRHEGEIDDEALTRLLAALRDDLDSGYDIVGYGATLAVRAGELALKHEGLRAYDALHLATAMASEGEEHRHAGATDRPTAMLSFDRRLVRAAREELELYFDPFPEQAMGRSEEVEEDREP